jgi:hypothetical protein
MRASTQNVPSCDVGLERQPHVMQVPGGVVEFRQVLGWNHPVQGTRLRDVRRVAMRDQVQSRVTDDVRSHLDMANMTVRICEEQH